MTDNPTPNEIALLREALIAMGRMIPGVILDDRVSNTFLANLPEEMAHYSLHRSPGQHDGAAGEGQASDAAKAAFNDAFDAYAQHMGDPDGRDDYEAANNAAGLVLDAFAKPSTEQARAEELVTLAECPPGPFLFDGRLGFKTEYGMTLPVPDDKGGRWEVTNWPDAYCMASGECFWGGAKSHAERAALMVLPVDATPSGADALGDGL